VAAVDAGDADSLQRRDRRPGDTFGLAAARAAAACGRRARGTSMKQVLVRSGGIAGEEAPAPAPGPRQIPVSFAYWCVGAGAELAGLRRSALPLYRRALKQPEHVRRALEMIREQGVVRTWERISGKLAAGSPTGYSAAGTVVGVGHEVEGFAAGD